MSKDQNIYTLDQWKEDSTFSAKAGQEVDEIIYECMHNVLPPKRIPREFALNKGFFAGFLMGEAVTCDKEGRCLYRAFGNKGDRYFYLGLVPEAR